MMTAKRHKGAWGPLRSVTIARKLCANELLAFGNIARDGS
jgi:hypothetical protein